MKILIKLKYLGSSFFGFQVQPDARTVQSTIQDSIESVYKKRFDVKGCSRTDSGVHANVYYATFDTGIDCNINIPTEKIPYALNSALPNDISVIDAIIVPDSFHIRHDVISKEYEYRIYCGKHKDPFEYERSYYIPFHITDHMVDLMNAAGDKIAGKHDFSCFMSSGSSVFDTIRNVKYVKTIKKNDIISIYACADGFLYNMVRIIAGTLLEVAREKFAPDSITDIINSRDRSLAGPTLPPHGLYLNKVEFKNIYF
ncbi:MAG: tRNA pseudouridine(38-40) synthase TruA [Ruminococcaceae bacterium]|nr:tRNA pseudouridine(38-40) synthase TruA [Oscillospiraceae bacterium]